MGLIMELVEKRRRFEEEAMPYLDSLYYFALKTTKDKEEAENLVQETFLKAFKFFESYTQGTNIKAWLFKILNNTFYTMKKKDNKEPKPQEDKIIESNLNASSIFNHPDMSATLDAELILMENIMDENLELAFSSLPSVSRQLLYLVDIEELPYEQVSNILEIPVGTVKSRVSRARNKLRESFVKRQKLEERGISNGRSM